LIAASVWITSVYTRSPLVHSVHRASCTVIRRVSEETMPVVTDGPPASPSA
jgi:hypothetical protein